jgi:hypothetical protein
MPQRLNAALLAIILVPSPLIGSGAAAETPSSSRPAFFDTVLQDPPEVIEAIEKERELFDQKAGEIREPLQRARAELAQANWWIAVPTARPATRLLLGVESPADRNRIAQCAAEARKHLEQGRERLGQVAGADKPDTEKQKTELDQSADTVAGFIDLLATVGLPADSETTREAWRKAGRRLALAREADDPDLAAAALLWQAYALDRSGRRERALEALPDTLEEPEHLPYDFLSRLLRCRLMAASGQSAAAVSLLARMEPQLKNWIDNQNQDRNNARRLIGLLQYRITREWMDQLSATTRPAADKLEPVLQNIEKSYAEVKSPRLYYLKTAVPLKIRPNASRTRNGRPTTASASRPD